MLDVVLHIAIGGARGIAGVAGPEMPTRIYRDRLSADGKLHFGIGSEELRPDAHQGAGGNRDFEVVQQGCSQQFVNQYARVLGVIAEFYDVPMTVIGLQKLALGASSHLADMANCADRHCGGYAVT